MAGGAWVDDGHRDAGRHEGRRARGLVASGGFEHDEGRCESLNASDERLDVVGRVGDLPGLSARRHGDIERGFRDINADEEGSSVGSIHRSEGLLARGPALRESGSADRSVGPGNCSDS